MTSLPPMTNEQLTNIVAGLKQDMFILANTLGNLQKQLKGVVAYLQAMEEEAKNAPGQTHDPERGEVS